MDDLAQKLNAMLADPNVMAQVQNVMSSLGGGTAGTPSPSPAPAAPAPQPAANSGPSLGGLADLLGGASQGGGSSLGGLASLLGGASQGGGSSLGGLAGLLGGAASQSAPAAPAAGGVGGLLGGLDMNTIGMITKVAPLLSTMQQEDDSTRLLRALRPMLSEARQKKLDEATKILQLMKMLPILRQSGLLGSLGGIL